MKNDAPGYELVRHPFSGLDPEAVTTVLLKVAAEKAQQFPVLLEKMNGLFRRKSPIHILAVIATYGSQVGVSGEGVAERAALTKIEQYHIELLQALVLSIPGKDWGTEPANSADIQEAIDTIVDLAEAFHQRRLEVVGQERTSDERAILALQERIRLHTQAVRNWGYFSDVVKISTELYSPLDPRLEDALGFSATDLFNVGSALVSLFERRTADRFKKLKRVFRERKNDGIIRQYFEEYPELKGTPEELIQVLKGASAETVSTFVLAHSDLSLPDIVSPAERDIGKATRLIFGGQGGPVTGCRTS